MFIKIMSTNWKPDYELPDFVSHLQRECKFTNNLLWSGYTALHLILMAK